MPTKRKILIISACLLTAVIAFSLLTHESEPSYKGVSLSEWCRLWSEPDGFFKGIRKEATDAIRHIGTNGLPYALEQISYEPTSLRQKVSYWIDKRFPKLSDSFLTMRHKFQRADQACAVFWVLRSQANAVIPDLTKLASDSKREESRNRAIFGLACIGKDAIPYLTTILADPRHPCRTKTIKILSSDSERLDIGTNGPAFVPLLASLSTNKNSTIAVYSIIALGRLQGEAKLVVPVLTNLLASSNRDVRSWVVYSLMFFGDKQSAERALVDPDFEVRSHATNALLFISHHVKTNTPAK